MNKLVRTALTTVFLLAAPLANSAVINVEATNVGSARALAPATLDSYFINGPGIGLGGALNYKSNFFVFDLGGVAGTVVGATLELQRYGASWFGGEANLSFRGIADPTPNLADAIFSYTGLGANYGNFSIDTSTGGSTDVLSFVLNANAIANINAALGGNFALNGNTTSTFSGLFSGSSSAGTQRLVLQTTVVPIPGAFLLFGSALLGLGAIKRKTA